jgi:hypothetical protein
LPKVLGLSGLKESDRREFTDRIGELNDRVLNGLPIAGEDSIINSGGVNNMDEVEARKKILDGTYPSNVVTGRQRKHIEGTREFEQNREKMNRLNPGSEPSILKDDPQTLVDRYRGTGTVIIDKSSPYPQEIIDTDDIIGKTWVKSMQKYAETKRIKIVYSSNGVHVIPISDYEGKW